MKAIILAIRRKWLKQLTEIQKFFNSMLLITGSWVIASVSPNLQWMLITTLLYVIAIRIAAYFVSSEFLVTSKEKKIKECIREMKKNSDCWSIYDILNDYERKEELHTMNVVLARTISKLSGRQVIIDQWGSWHWDHDAGPVLY